MSKSPDWSKNLTRRQKAEAWADRLLQADRAPTQTKTYLAVYDGPGGPISATFDAPAFSGWPVGNPVIELVAQHGDDWYTNQADVLGLDPDSTTADIKVAVIAGGWTLRHKAEDAGQYSVYVR